jgi:Flp pilus assembly protein TadG
MRLALRSSARQRHHGNARSGVAAAEFVVVLPLIVALLLGVWEVGQLIEITQMMNNAAREGARVAATGKASIADVQQTVLGYLQAAAIPTGNAAVVVQNTGFPGNPPPPDNNPINATELDQLQVSVSIPFSDVRWIALYVVTNANTRLSGQSVWCSLKDIPYPEVGYPPPE